jgi:glutathione S-transferase
MLLHGFPFIRGSAMMLAYLRVRRKQGMAIRLYELVGRHSARPFSPHCWKAAFALAHKGLDFERVPTRFTEIGRIEGGISRTVPVIRDGDRVVADSFAIALYLEETYPDRPTLFAGAGGKAMARFIERWTQIVIHSYLGAAVLLDIHDMLEAEDQSYFRSSREARYGRRLEEVPAGREDRLPAFRASLEPLRSLLSMQPFIGGRSPLFCDYIVAGAFQWMRVVSSFRPLDHDDPVAAWFERCLDLHDGFARSVPEAA